MATRRYVSFPKAVPQTCSGPAVSSNSSRTSVRALFRKSLLNRRQSISLCRSITFEFFSAFLRPFFVKQLFRRSIRSVVPSRYPRGRTEMKSTSSFCRFRSISLTVFSLYMALPSIICRQRPFICDASSLNPQFSCSAIYRFSFFAYSSGRI